MKQVLKLFTLTFLYILVIPFFNNLKAQETFLDSLFIQVNALPDDSSKVLELNNLCFKYRKIQLDTALLLGKEALELSEKLNYQYGIAQSLFQLGLVLRYKSNYEKAIEYSQLSYELFDKMGKSSEKARVLSSLGNVYKRIGDYNKSMENFLASIKIYENVQDSLELSKVQNNLGILYQDFEQYDKALEYYNKSLKVKENLKLKKQVVISLMNIGVIYKKKKEYIIALDYYKRALELTDENTSKYDKLLLLHNLGSLYEFTQYYDAAERYYLEAIKIEEELGDKDMLIFSFQGMGKVLAKKGKDEEGILYLLRSYDLAKESGNLSKEKELLYSLSWAFKKIGEYKKSLHYYEDYHSISDSLLGVEKIKQITELEQKYETEKRDQQIAFLEKEKAIQELELSNKRIEARQKSFQRNILVIITLAAIGLLVYYFRDNKKRRKLINLLRKQNVKIIDQRAEIAKRNDELIDSNKTKDSLFQIIAHDLRSPLVSIDSITQLIPFWVEERDYESLEKLASKLELSINNVLSLIDNLLNWALNQQGKFPFKPEKLKLRESIDEVVKVYEPIAHIKNIELEFSSTKNILVYADRNMFFTILRNLLNNAIKFTPEKGNIAVGMENTNGEAKIWVKDTGVGIPKDKLNSVFDITQKHAKGTKGEAGKGLGLFFCKEFVAINKGGISIESEEGEGTTITFTLPVFNLAESKT